MNRFQILSRGKRTRRGEMNKTESRYADLLKANPDVAWFRHEPFSLRLSSPAAGQPARYTPDFLIVMQDGTTYLDDVKGSGMDDAAAAVRAKCAAEIYPIWTFRIAKERRKKDGGGWDVRIV